MPAKDAEEVKETYKMKENVILEDEAEDSAEDLDSDDLDDLEDNSHSANLHLMRA